MIRGSRLKPTDEMMQVFNATPFLDIYKYAYCYMVRYIEPFDVISTDFIQCWPSETLVAYLFPYLNDTKYSTYVSEEYLLSCANPEYKDALETASLELNMGMV